MFQRLKDLMLEREISAAHRAIVAAETQDEAREHFMRMAKLINQRSPAQVARMEQERGLV